MYIYPTVVTRLKLKTFHKTLNSFGKWQAVPLSLFALLLYGAHEVVEDKKTWL